MKVLASPNPSTFDVQRLTGWLPVDAIVSNGRPALSWMDFRGEKLTEPFFQQTVSKLRSREPPPEEIITDLDVVLQFEKISDSLRPDGFIFHSSRCGSTLLANVCRCLDDSIVISEAEAIDKLAARFITDTGNGDARETLYSVVLRGVVNALAQRRNGNERRFFIKFSCCTTTQLSRIRRIWPNVPWVFLYRDPVETIVSNLASTPRWMRDQDQRVLASIIKMPVEAVDLMSQEELCARSIASFYSTACELANEKCLLLNYSELSLTTILQLLQSIHINPSASEVDAIKRVSQIYSKDVDGTRAFVDDIGLKQGLASPLVQEVAEKWAGESYRSLERKRLSVRQV